MTKPKGNTGAYEYNFLNNATKTSVSSTPPRNSEEPNAKEGDWLAGEDYAGQLAVDVYQSGDDIVIKSTIAGVKPEDIDISINNDMITIRGKRTHEEVVAEDDYFYRECYWGGFSRSIILPCEVKVDRIRATMKNGILNIVLPKATKVSKVTVVKVKEE
ncbi:MAG: Hsp20/alpha crystallin family protein [Patescibacteria group bacterium]|nr:Hsp20/alpha crystallin family protein [Patescibacteria group bacterium]MDD5715665.1 Hsp20/alpha crystallin family protein [Patescibacteria group bacterium]